MLLDSGAFSGLGFVLHFCICAALPRKVAPSHEKSIFKCSKWSHTRELSCRGRCSAANGGIASAYGLSSYNSTGPRVEQYGRGGFGAGDIDRPAARLWQARDETSR